MIMGRHVQIPHNILPLNFHMSRNSDTARAQTSWSNGEGRVLICPTEWFGHGFVEVDKIADPAGQVALGLEVAATDELENQISIWLSQEACLSVKWNPKGGSGSLRNA